jgi:hypothetical protein
MTSRRRFLGLLSVPLAAAACTTTEGVPPQRRDVPAPPPRAAARGDDALATIGAAVLDGSRAMIAAALGEPHDARWDCSDPRIDLRATPPETAQRLEPLGDLGELIIAGIDGVALVSPVWQGAVEEATPPADERPRWLAVTGELVVWPDRRVRWATIRSSVDVERPHPDASVRLKDLPAELREPLADLVLRLSAPGCDVPLVTQRDIAALDLSADAARGASEALVRDARRVALACHDAGTVRGPWSARVRRLNALVTVRGGVVHLASELRFFTDHLCLGPVEVRSIE